MPLGNDAHVEILANITSRKLTYVCVMPRGMYLLNTNPSSPLAGLILNYSATSVGCRWMAGVFGQNVLVVGTFILYRVVYNINVTKPQLA